MATESPPAPAVVAVVITRDPGPWFAEALTSLADQDYPNLSVLVVDAGSAEDPTPTVASVMPGAFVRRLERRVGFGTAANEVLEIVEGASHFLFCHDDVALAPDAVRLMVEEAFRSNAGVASPKFVQWDAPERLLAVGLTTDKVGAVRNIVDPGELDQEQHDAVREVLVAPSGAMLVRADLFAALGGFDPVVDRDGEDIDLSWRARLFGARVMVVPAARVRHLEAESSGGRGRRPDPARRERNRYRTLLTCYRWYTLAWIVPLALFWALGEMATMVVQGRFADARVALGALGGSVRRSGQLRHARRRVQRHRAIGDHDLRALQIRGNARFRGFVQSHVDDVRSGLQPQGPSPRPALLGLGGPEPDADGRAVAPPDPSGPPGRRNLNGLILATLLVVFVIGTRSLFGKGLPQIGTLPDTSIGWAGIWRTWWSTWQPGGMGVGAPGPPAAALLGLLGTGLFGAVGTLQHLVVLGPLVVGPIGAYRAARHWGSVRGQVVAAVAYAIVPLPYNALAGGHWDGLVVYAAVPWVLSTLIRLSSLVPAPPTRLARIRGRVLGLAMVTAVVAAVAPSFLYVVPIMGLALVGGSAVAGRPAGSLRLLGLSLAAAVGAFVLLLPWSATVVANRVAVAGVDPGPAGRLGLGSILRFQTGPFGAGGWEWLLLVAAALPLFVGRGWRLEWAARLWVTALVFFALAWAGRRGWIPALPLGVVLAPAAAALAGSTALGAAAFEIDLPGYNFGWRQAAAAVAGVGLALASIPWFAAAGGGRWDLPSADAASVLSTFLPGHQKGDYRVLWVGSPDGLPLAGRQLEAGFAYGATFDGGPGLSDDWATGPAGAAPRLASDLLLVQGRLTTRLGHLLAPAGVRDLVIPNHVGPSGSGGSQVPVPGALLAGLGLQTDLQAVDVGDPDYTVYENAAWAPVRSVLPAVAARHVATEGPAGLRALQQIDLTGSRPVLTGGSAHSVSGSVPSGRTIFVGSSRSGGWHLSAGGRNAPATAAFGWGMSFEVPAAASPGELVGARLGYTPPWAERGGYVLAIVLWIASILVVIVDRRHRARTDRTAPERVDPAWFAPAVSAPRPTRPYHRPGPRPPGFGPPTGPGRPGRPARSGPAGAAETDPENGQVRSDV
jgi:GT2 family glycosyltransferase